MIDITEEGYNGKWIDSFQFTLYDGKRRNCKGKIRFKTPSITYYMTREQFEELKEKVNNFDY